MILKIFAILDKKAMFYGAPICFHNKSEALRGFAEHIQDPNSLVSKYPADFSIWQLGTYDQLTGVITPETKPLFLDEAVNLLPPPKK